MRYVKGVLSGISALTVVLVGPWIIFAIMDANPEKATGLTAVSGGLTAALFSPLHWVALCLVVWLLWTAGRLKNTALRVILFWIPTVVISTIGLAMLAFLSYVYFHFARG
jgi:hypothetical protein